MKRQIGIIVLMVFLLGMLGCPAKTKEETATKIPEAPKQTTKAQQIKPVLVSEEKQRPEYVVMGVRDPFQSYEISKPEETKGKEKIIDPLQKIALSQVELVGIIVGKEPRALVQDNSGLGYIVKEGTRIGENSGIVTSITPNDVTIKQHFKDYMGRVNTREVVFSLRKEEGER
jgi:Tfp pilus assembly protein PilP